MATAVNIFSLVSRHGKRSLLFQVSSPLTKQARLSLSTTSASPQEVVRKMVPDESFWNKNERMKRPMSPHVTIYKFELPPLLSITHRGTGLYLSAVIAGMGLAALALPGGLSSGIEIIKAMNLPLWALAPIKFSLVFPFVYHTLNGVRHLAWDTGRGFQMSTLYKTGYIVVMTSLLASGCIVAYFSSS